MGKRVATLTKSEAVDIYKKVHQERRTLGEVARTLGGVRRITLEERLMRTGFSYQPTLVPLTPEAAAMIGVPFIPLHGGSDGS